MSHVPDSLTNALSGMQKPMRSDGVEARNRLLDAALALFAEKGFAKTSTREIAQAAQVNVASISYYFGDKEGLYRAVFEDPRSNPNIDPAALNVETADLREVLAILFRGFVEPLKQGHLIQQCMKLHFREMLEPTGVWQAEIDNNIKPVHAALVAALCRHLVISEADDDVHRLAFSVTGLAMMLHVGGDVLHAIRPAVIDTPSSLDLYCVRLVDFAMAMVADEAKRRSGRPTSPSAKARKTAKSRPASH
jgi:TetR/AcrR family transcriptional regulator, regulator of cefoperazone and chloramphenicol sensitivity